MDERPLTRREQNLIENLGEVWQLPHEISADTLKNITKFLVTLEKSYQVVGFQAIAEYIASTINLHMLSLMALVQQADEAAGISATEVEFTLKQVSSSVFQTIDQLGKQLSISSLDDLATLSNILISLQTLSQSESAQEAQSWLYDLPTLCHEQLMQENIIAETAVPEPGYRFESQLSSGISGVPVSSWSYSSDGAGKSNVITFRSEDSITISKPSDPTQGPMLLERDSGRATDAA